MKNNVKSTVWYLVVPVLHLSTTFLYSFTGCDNLCKSVSEGTFSGTVNTDTGTSGTVNHSQHEQCCMCCASNDDYRNSKLLLQSSLETDVSLVHKY